MKDRIGVLGAGLMGHGIAQLFAAGGHPVSLYDTNPDVLGRAMGEMKRICALLAQDESVLGGIVLQTDFDHAVRDADIVIEAVPEKIELKQTLFVRLEQICRPDTLLASNTSVIPISRIAEPLENRNRVMGTHFWNPPGLVPLVEVIETADTGESERDHMMSVLAALGREPVLVRRDIPGFVGNRLQHALKREAIALVAEGVCDAETVDKVIKLGFGPRLSVLGTLEQSDMVGLNLTLDIHEVVIPDLDVTPGPHPFLRDLVAQGHLGMKTGRGFYEWTPERAEAVRRKLQEFLAARALAVRNAALDGTT